MSHYVIAVFALYRFALIQPHFVLNVLEYIISNLIVLCNIFVSFWCWRGLGVVIINIGEEKSPSQWALVQSAGNFLSPADKWTLLYLYSRIGIIRNMLHDIFRWISRSEIWHDTCIQWYHDRDRNDEWLIVTYRWPSERPQYLHCISNGDTTLLH